MPPANSSRRLGPARPLPASVPAEESVLGGILFRGTSYQLVSDIVEAADFSDPRHVVIYEAMVALDQRGSTIDLVTVAEVLRGNGKMAMLAASENEVYLADLANRIASTEGIQTHAQLVRNRATRRRAILELSARSDSLYDSEQDLTGQIDAAQQALMELANRQAGATQTIVSVRRVLHAAVGTIEARFKRQSAITGIRTGFERFDDMTAGLQPNELIIIAARPSMGKTAFAMACAQNAALDSAVPSLIFSLEMSKESLLERVLCSDSSVALSRVKTGMLSTKDWIQISKSASRIAEAPMWFDDSSAPTFAEIRAKLRRWRADKSIFPNGLDDPALCVVDYLQLITGGSPGMLVANREQEISAHTRSFKALAKSLRMPIVVLSQLNRNLESRADKRPMMSDLRESGAIEQDADTIVFLYRDEQYNKASPDAGLAEVIIGKQRNGPTGTATLRFEKECAHFSDYQPEEIGWEPAEGQRKNCCGAPHGGPCKRRCPERSRSSGSMYS